MNGVEVVNFSNGTRIQNMNDGDLAEVLEWHPYDRNVGTILQRYGNYLIVVGKSSCEGFGEFFNNSTIMKNCKAIVRILEKGTILKVK